MKEDHESTEKSILNSAPRYTEKQEQYLAFIHYYTKINQHPPAEADMQRFFEVSAPSANNIKADKSSEEDCAGNICPIIASRLLSTFANR